MSDERSRGNKQQSDRSTAILSTLGMARSAGGAPSASMFAALQPSAAKTVPAPVGSAGNEFQCVINRLDLYSPVRPLSLQPLPVHQRVPRLVRHRLRFKGRYSTCSCSPVRPLRPRKPPRKNAIRRPRRGEWRPKSCRLVLLSLFFCKRVSYLRIRCRLTVRLMTSALRLSLS